MSTPPLAPTDEGAPHLTELPLGARLRVIRRALVRSARERRTKRALFFTLASLMVGLTVGGSLGLLICGLFGGSLYLVVLVLRMQRHLRIGAHEYRVEHGMPEDAGH